MKVGDLVIDKHFNQYGIVTTIPKPLVRQVHKQFDEIFSWEYVWVIWQHGAYTQHKVDYLKVVNEKRNKSKNSME